MKIKRVASNVTDRTMRERIIIEGPSFHLRLISEQAGQHLYDELLQYTTAFQ